MKQELRQIYRNLSKGDLSQKEAFEKIKAIKLQEEGEKIGALLAAPVWQAEAPPEGAELEYASRHVILLELSQVDANELGTLIPNSHCLSPRAEGQKNIAQRYSEYALACFEVIQGIFRGKPKGKALAQIVIGDYQEQALFAGLAGLLKTASLENPGLIGQLLLVPAQTTAEELGRLLREEKTDWPDPLIRYERGARQVLRLQEAPGEQEKPPIAFKDQGVYLITGGLGSLGLLFAREILAVAPRAHVALTGRSALGAETQSLLDGLSAPEGRLSYRRVDLGDPEQVRRLIADVQDECGRLNGILHCAGMIADNFILKKTGNEFREVLAPKVTGTYNLDEASRDVDLDFFALFSSIAGAMGNVGQADYAAANGFLDQFAAYRNRQVAMGERRGRTLSVNWPLWQAGGMTLDPASRELMRQTTGLQPMKTATGLQAFYRGLATPYDQVLVVEGDLTLIRRALFASQPTGPAWTPLAAEAEQPAAAEAAAATMDADSLLERTQDYLRRQLSEELKLPSHKIDPEAALEKYGIDSILAMKLTNQLEKTFGSLPKTLFFEYQTIAELAEYFTLHHSKQLAKQLAKQSAKQLAKQLAKQSAARLAAPLAAPLAGPLTSTASHHNGVSPPTAQILPPAGARRISNRRVSRPRGAAPSATADVGPIAIIGLSGRYPEAVDVEAYWRNLREGKDCVVEVPRERWDWREYYSEDRTQSGRHYSKWGGFIAGVDEFDPLFFNISPKEAKYIDPQERLFLQHAWMAIEDAGYTRASLQTACEQDLPGQVGVYVGVMYIEYQLFGAEASARGKRLGIADSAASVANRVSYALNLHGPSLTLDTMCSSSLTAIHLACQDLKLGRTSLAIAGGVNLSIHPNKYLALSAGQFISSDGHCQSFGEGGDGYIPGEGVGVVVLKRLSEAERDGDHIYGIIRGSALNHGGKTNGYTVPNPQAQASVISRALAESRTDPRQVSYIEAHGTGTRLGDPIEIAALSKAFGQYTQDTGFCLIGSVKSNIGHCESAAGIAGLTKILLQMRHGQIAPSLHSARLNPHIDFAKTPFVVNQELKEWEAPEIEGRRLPRIAGISSFGAGGSNAHLIVEEYLGAEPGPETATDTEVVIALSARTAEQLRQKARDLLEYVLAGEKTVDPVGLVGMAYTLQVGREGMEERLGLVVNSVGQLVEKLKAYVAGEDDLEDVYRGQAKRQNDTLALFSADADLRQTVDKWIENRKLTKLAELWAKGLEVEWSKLYGEARPKRVSLPTYPFAKDRYWIDLAPVSATDGRGGGQSAATAVLHPLLHSNTSDLSEQRYSSIFTGQEFFLADHQVAANGHGGQRVLPAVAYLEMARAAIDRAVPSGLESTVLELRNTVWAQPVVVAGEKRVEISLAANDQHEIDYEIYSREADLEVIHCQGRAVLGHVTEPARLDLDGLMALMDRGQVEPGGVYAMCARMGLIYGPSFQGITAIHRGRDQILAKLRLPGVVAITSKDYWLHPSLMDGALQAAVGLIDGELESNLQAGRPRLPFALETLRVIAPCAPEMVAWVRYAPGSRATDAVIKLDLDLCDERGNVCAQLRGLSSRALSKEIKTAATQGRTFGSLLAIPVWEAGSAEESAAAGQIEYAEHHVVLCEIPNVNVNQLGPLLPHSQCLSLRAEPQQNIAQRYGEYALACFERVQTIFRGRPQGKALVQIVVPEHQEQVMFVGLSGLLRTAAQENPQLIGQLILTPASTTAEELAGRLQSEMSRGSGAGLDPLVRYRGGERQVLGWQEAPESGEEPPIAFNDGGVYIITGGLGGIGLLFAKEILAKTRGARVVLTGRSALTPEKDALLEEMSGQSGRVSYRQADVSDLDQVTALITAVKDEYGQLNGILHGAGVIADDFILKKSGAQFREVLAPKVMGAYNLDEASRHVELDFFALFSSLAGAVGNLGQADYAAANGFLDQFAAHRNRQVAANRRHGRTRSINWPLWEAGGMGVDPSTQELLRQMTGMAPMRTSTGLEAFYRSLALPYDQTLIVEGDLAKIRRALLARPAAPSEPRAKPPEAPARVGSDNLVAQTQDYLRRQFSELMKMPSHKIDPHAALEEYGIDSILAMKLTNHLEKTFGSLSKTLFFEYQTIAGLARYFAKAHQAIVSEKLGLLDEGRPAPGADTARVDDKRPIPAVRSKNRFLGPQTDDRKEIAIVGLAGRYPQAENLEEFWRNLQNGRDCITEIPPERWEHALYYDPDQSKPGKTYSKWGGFIADVDKFDPLFFNISPKEAALIDPQERLFLETAWQAIEDAGYAKEGVAGGRVGVYVGVMWGQYELFGAESLLNGETSIPISSHSSIANRVSYFFDFHGPSIALDTMCSSSLTAIHLACDGLRRGEIDAAIAGGVNLTIHPYKYLSLSQGKFVASDGRCRSFGAGGDGYVPGEGVGAVLLKPLEDALRDGDQVYAVIKSSAANHGGKTNGYTVPNPIAQADLILEALRKAKIDPKTLSYVETHGTGTSLGDPIEITGLMKAFEGSADEKQFCPIGSVKSNIGHLESAAGIAALTKALLQIKHEQLVPSLHADPLNPNIDFGDTPFYVQTRLAEWKRSSGHPRRVGVSSFGAGGSNAHLILEEYAGAREPEGGSPAAAPEAFVLSARDERSLRRYAEKVVEHLESVSGVSLANLAYTSQVGRTPMPARLVIIAASLEDLRDKLSRWASLQDSGGDPSGGPHELEDVFCGNVQKTQYSAGSLIEGRAGKTFLRELLENRDLATIAKLWILGAEIDWTLLRRQSVPRRVSLPTYPFAKERCWVNRRKPSPRMAQPLDPRTASALEGPEEKRRLSYSLQWKLKSLAASGERFPAIGPILMLNGPDSLVEALREQLESRSVRGPIVRVIPGKTFREIEPNVYAIDTEREEQFSELVENLRDKALLPGLILHHDEEACDLEDDRQVARGLNHGVYTLFHFCKALMKLKGQTQLKIMSVFSSRGESSAPLGAAISGFFKTLTLENPRYLAKAVDLQSGPDGGEFSLIEKAGLICEEICENDWVAQEIRYRRQLDGDKWRYIRYVGELLPSSLMEKDSSASPLRQGGVYLITGGLGGLGLIFGEYLARNFQAKLVLVGRSAPGPTHEERISRLTRCGAEVLYLQADVSKPEDAHGVVREAKARFSQINGVIHAAGVNHDAFVLKKTRAEMDAVLAPKVYGAINLDLATSGENLDLFALFSSVAGVLGNPGQCDYAYGNRFLDSFAEGRENLRRAQKRWGRTLSIDWPLWEEGGMRISQGDVARLERQTGICPLPTEEGIRYWEDFLRSDAVQRVALYGIPSRIDAYIAQKKAQSSRNKPAQAEGVDLAKLFAKTENYLKEMIGGEINLAPDRIGTSDRLESFGIDSVMVAQFNANLERDLGALPKTLFYEYETVAELARFLLAEAREPLEAMFGGVGSAIPGTVRVPVRVIPGEDRPPQSNGAAPVRLFSEESDIADRDWPPQSNGAVPLRLFSEEESDVADRDWPPVGNGAKVVTASLISEEPIAIIGVHGRYPHSANLDEYWNHLKHGRDLIDLVPRDRWDYEEFYHPDPAAAADGKIYCKWGGFLDDYDKFDPHFFNIPVEEAKVIDPQERLFLESVWAAIEDAGYTRDSLRTRFPKAKSADVGVFVGVTTNSYHLWAPEERSRGNFVCPGAMPWSIANRVSYFFDFNGPSMPVDTACSSSLVALHLACESLRNRECQVAIAGGVNLYLHPSKYHSLCQGRMLSLGGKCHSYGAGDNGFVPGEGVGTVVLKPLSKAVADQDHIYAVIVGDAYDHSGRSNGYSAPNPNSQANLISRVLEKAQINPETIGYVEGHGTGTRLGDPIEIAALTKAFRKRTAKTEFCPIGSVKANIGHSESAAGMASLAKVILQMQRRQLAPSLHSDEVNPDIEFTDSPFYLQHGLSDWAPLPGHPRRALINSFGAGGVNACLIVEEHRNVSAPRNARATGPRVFAVSAKNEERLREYVNRLLVHLRSEPDIDLVNLCYTLQTGREAMEERLAMVVSNVVELIDRLGRWSDRRSSADIYRGSPGPRRGSTRSSKIAPTDLGEQSLTDLASRWAAGEDVNWESLYPGTSPRRIGLPTYPFARERYWIADAPIPKRQSLSTPQLHPLIGYNSSTLKEVCFSSSLSDAAFYAVDHKVNGERLFPGAGFLEMACIAGNIAGEQRVRKIKDIVWAQPLLFRTGPQTLRTALKDIWGGAEYTISSSDDENEPIVHSEGRLDFEDDWATPDGARDVPEDRIQIQSLKAQCGTPQPAADFYRKFSDHGLQYGPSFQTLQEIYISATFALSELRLPDHLKGDYDQFILHPSMIDGALQTIAALVGSGDRGTPHVPFALDEVEIIHPLPQTCYAYVEYADSPTRNHTGAWKFNIRILNESGGLLVALRNLYVRPIGKPPVTGRPVVAAEWAANGWLPSPSGGAVR
jgi:polyketide synthase PksN